MSLPSAGGGFHAILYTLKKAREAGGILRLYRALRAKNACKTCALGMGGQSGGMVNEAGHFPEFCKKSVQALVADLQDPIPETAFTAPFDYLTGLSPRQLEGLGRLTTPLVAEVGSDRYRAATWHEAITRISAKLIATTPDESFFYASGRSANEAGFLMHLMARCYGTNNVNNCSFYCHQASGVGLSDVLGAGTGTVTLADLDQTDLVILIGGNPASNHPRLLRTLMDLKRRGGTVISINPLNELGLERFRVPSDPRSLLFGTTIADQIIQPNIGGDIPLLLAVAKRVLELGAHDQGWLEANTTGFPELAAHLRSLDLSDLLTRAGIDRPTLDRLVDAYARSKATVFAWAMGITHHLHGVDNVRAIAALALLRGMCGRDGAGLFPLRGHSNIQGLGTIGFTPTLKQTILERIEARFQITLPTTPGLDTMASMNRAAAGGIRSAWALGGNLYGSNPDATFAGRAFAVIDQVVYLNTTLNTGHVHGRGQETWVLPVLARDEEPQGTTQESMFSYVRLSDGGQPHHPGPRSEVQVIAAVAQRLLGETPIAWGSLADHGNVRQAIAAVVPGLEGLAEIDATKKEFHIPGRTRRGGAAGAPARLRIVHPPQLAPLAANQLRVMTIRSEGQFNSVVYEDHDRYRGTTRRDVILMAAADRNRLGLSLEQTVMVRNEVGEMRLRVADGRIRAGNAAVYYPEANLLVPRAVDPESGTPAFKSVVVTITPAS